MEQVLLHYGVQPPSGSGWRKVRCPHPDHVDRRASASVNLEEEALRCFGCGLKGGPIKIIQQIEGVSVDRAEAICQEVAPGSGTALSRRGVEGRRGPTLFNKPAESFERGSGLFSHRGRS